MALTAGQRATIRDWLDVAAPKIRALQDAALAKYGRYIQCRGSHTIIPQNAIATPPDRLLDRPQGEEGRAEGWIEANLGLAWPVAIELHVYRGPFGQGYVGVAKARGSLGEVWSVHRNVGPETHRERAIAQETAGPL